MKHDSDIIKRIKSYFMRRKSAGEAYEFEREMERDPFLYEAMEGFEDMLTSDIQQALDELDYRLDEKKKRRFFVITWQAAAIGLILVVGVSVFAILGSQKDEVESYSQEDANYSPRNINPEFSEMEEIEQSLVSEEGESQPNKIEDTPAIIEPDYAMNDAIPKKELMKQEASAEPVREKATRMQAETELAIVEAGKSMDNTQAMDEVAMASPKAKPAETTSLAAPQMSRQESQISSTTSAASEPRPQGGMASYQSYLKKNLQKSDGMPNGSVVISFEFEKDGTPKKIEISKSLCTACDAEAKRLIENGPKWNVEDRKERVSVTVTF